MYRTAASLKASLAHAPTNFVPCPFLWNRNHKSGFESDKSDKSDKSDNSTPSGKATRDASKRVEEYYTDRVKVVTKADKSPPWEL